MKIVAIAGGFDPLHRGHILHIEKALALGDALLIILARDDQLDIKKNGRRGFSFAERKFILEWGLMGKGKPFKVVSNIDKDLTCAETLKLYKPEIFAKGGDRTPETMPKNEIEMCEKINCQIIYGVGEQLQSSSRIIEKLLRGILPVQGGRAVEEG